MFELSKALETVIDLGADLLLGKPKRASEDSIEDTGVYFTGEKSTGFLGRIVATGVKTFGSGETSAERTESTGLSLAEIKSLAKANSTFSPTVSSGGQATRFMPTNPMYIEALKRRLQSANYDANLERLTSQYTISPKSTIVGSKPSSPGSTTVTRKIAAPTAKV
tara:strand:- start:40 stop:534 length:495 start_codon:yes stop_codon:yes gene_type:complete